MFGDPRLPERFWKKVTRADSGCWIWVGAIQSGGYGNFQHEGKTWRAHRLTFSVEHELIPGMTLDHLCRARPCCNPECLEQVSRGENVLRGVGIAAQNARKTHCKRGHIFDEENTTIIKKTGARKCRACNRAAMRRRKAT